jgi:hypothetical protein
LARISISLLLKSDGRAVFGLAIVLGQFEDERFPTTPAGRIAREAKWTCSASIIPRRHWWQAGVTGFVAKARLESAKGNVSGDKDV